MIFLFYAGFCFEAILRPLGSDKNLENQCKFKFALAQGKNHKLEFQLFYKSKVAWDPGLRLFDFTHYFDLKYL